MSWRWRHLPLVAGRDGSGGRRVALADATRSLGAVVSAGVLAGVLVLGLGGRLVMRLLAATSGAAVQGRLTEAGEQVGEITVGGTIGFLVFVGVLGGLVSALGYLVVRRWLPGTAGPAGLVAGVILVGTLGVLDPFSPDNVDFAILRPRWLAIVAVVATGLLFAVTLTATAARLDRSTVQDRWSRWLPCAGLVVLVPPPLALFGAIYIAGRVVAAGRVRCACWNGHCHGCPATRSSAWRRWRPCRSPSPPPPASLPGDQRAPVSGSTRRSGWSVGAGELGVVPGDGALDVDHDADALAGLGLDERLGLVAQRRRRPGTWQRRAARCRGSRRSRRAGGRCRRARRRAARCRSRRSRRVR